MNYLIGRDIDNDGYLEFIQNMNTMALTEDPSRALQFTAADLNYIDMAYMNSLGFYAVEAPRFGVSLLESLLFRPTVRSYRPPVAPPPRRRRNPAPGMHPHPAPRGPVGGPAPRGPVNMGPGPRGPVNMGPGPRGPVSHGPGPGNPGPGGRGPGGRGMGGPGGRGMGGPGGFGPGR